MSERSEQTQVGLHALTPRERNRLEGILARLASPYESERATAALLASAFVTRHALTWSHLTSLLQPLPHAAVPAALAPNPPHGSKAEARLYCQPRAGSQGQALDLFT